MGKRIQKVKYESTVSGAISDAFSIIEELAGEMREAFENTPESLQQGGAGAARGEAADQLESISELDVDDKFGEIKIEFEYKPVRNPSRRERRDEAAQMLGVAINALEELEFPVSTLEEAEELSGERDDLVSDIQNMLDEADGVEFPGMFG